MRKTCGIICKGGGDTFPCAATRSRNVALLFALIGEWWFAGFSLAADVGGGFFSALAFPCTSSSALPGLDVFCCWKSKRLMIASRSLSFRIVLSSTSGLESSVPDKAPPFMLLFLCGMDVFLLFQLENDRDR